MVFHFSLGKSRGQRSYHRNTGRGSVFGKKVVLDLQDAQVERPTINMIQSLVENRLMEAGFINIAEHYISYRLQRDLERNGYGDKVIVHLRFEQTK